MNNDDISDSDSIYFNRSNPAYTKQSPNNHFQSNLRGQSLIQKYLSQGKNSVHSSARLRNGKLTSPSSIAAVSGATSELVLGS